MKKQYFLTHTCKDEQGKRRTRFIGAYSSEEEARRRIDDLQDVTGFCDYSKKCFQISCYETDDNNWVAGFQDGEQIAYQDGNATTQTPKVSDNLQVHRGNGELRFSATTFMDCNLEEYVDIADGNYLFEGVREVTFYNVGIDLSKGGLLFAPSVEQLNIVGCRITGSGISQRGIYTSSSSTIVTDSVFQNFVTAPLNITQQGMPMIAFTNCTFENCYHREGSLLMAKNAPSATVLVTECTFDFSGAKGKIGSPSQILWKNITSVEGCRYIDCYSIDEKGIPTSLVSKQNHSTGRLPNLKPLSEISHTTNKVEQPTFKYHPNFYESEAYEPNEGVCNCCGKTVVGYYGTMYTSEDVDCLCLPCIASGLAAKKFDGIFIDYAPMISDPDKRDELHHRTPGYVSWQGERWKACCDDYCAFLGDTDSKQLEELGICDQVLEEYNEENDTEVEPEDLDPDEGYMNGYLFRCLHCKKYHLEADCS